MEENYQQLKVTIRTEIQLNIHNFQNQEKYIKIYSEMIAEGDYYAFGWAARNGHEELVKIFIANCDPDKLQNMIATLDSYTFRTKLVDHKKTLKLIYMAAQDNSLDAEIFDKLNKILVDKKFELAAFKKEIEEDRLTKGAKGLRSFMLASKNKDQTLTSSNKKVTIPKDILVNHILPSVTGIKNKELSNKVVKQILENKEKALDSSNKSLTSKNSFIESIRNQNTSISI